MAQIHSPRPILSITCALSLAKIENAFKMNSIQRSVTCYMGENHWPLRSFAERHGTDGVFGRDSRLRYLNSNLQQFAMDARSSPSGSWRGSFAESDCEFPETPLGDLCNADSSMSNRGEIPCDARR